jgi:hypothetical protein
MSRRHVVVLGAALVLAGCSSDPGPEESREAVEKMHDSVVDTVLELQEALDQEGLALTSAAGDYSVCGVEPASSVEFAAGAGTSADSGSVAEQLELVRAAVVDAGWTEDGSPTQVYATKGDLRVSASEAKAERGTLAIEVVHDCVDADRDVVDELLTQGSEKLVE